MDSNGFACSVSVFCCVMRPFSYLLHEKQAPHLNECEKDHFILILITKHQRWPILIAQLLVNYNNNASAAATRRQPTTVIEHEVNWVLTISVELEYLLDGTTRTVLCVFVCLLCKKMRARDAQKISFLHTKVSRIQLTYTQCTKEQNKIFTFDTFHLISKLKNSFRNTQLFNLYFIVYVLQTKSFLCGTVWHEMLFPPTRLCLVSIHRTKSSLYLYDKHYNWSNTSRVHVGTHLQTHVTHKNVIFNKNFNNNKKRQVRTREKTIIIVTNRVLLYVLAHVQTLIHTYTHCTQTTHTQSKQNRKKIFVLHSMFLL